MKIVVPKPMKAGKKIVLPTAAEPVKHAHQAINGFDWKAKNISDFPVV